MIRFNYIPLSLAVASLLAGCTVIKYPESRTLTATTTTRTASDGTKTTVVTAKETTPKPKKKKKNKQSVVAVTEEKKGHETALSADILTGQWSIVTAGGQTIEPADDEVWPYLEFEPARQRFYGNNGCNVINGNYVVEPGDLISFGDVISTMRFCDVPYESAITAAINSTMAYSLVRDGNEYVLTFLDSQHQPELVMRKHNLGFLNGMWKVVKVNNSAIDDAKINMVIDIPEGRVHGYAGCNILNGQIVEDPNKPNSIQFHSLMTTRMTCPDIAVETEFLVALEEVEFAKAERKGVKLLNNQGHTVIELKQMDPNSLQE